MIQFARGSRWLQRFFDERLDEVFCGRIHCTTCGGGPFWVAFDLAIATELEQPIQDISPGRVDALVLSGLRSLSPGPDSSRNFGEAVSVLLHRFWSLRASGALEGTWVADFLAERGRIDRAAYVRRRAQEEFQHPETARRRREAKRQTRQEAHLQRKAKYRELGLRWLQRRPNEV